MGAHLLLNLTSPANKAQRCDILAAQMVVGLNRLVYCYSEKVNKFASWGLGQARIEERSIPYDLPHPCYYFF